MLNRRCKVFLVSHPCPGLRLKLERFAYEDAMAKNIYRARKAGIYVVKAAESRSARVAPKKDGRAATPPRTADRQLARAVLENWRAKPTS